jgi:hypothetical protein
VNYWNQSIPQYCDSSLYFERLVYTRFLAF